MNLTNHEELISRQQLEVDISAEKRYAELNQDDDAMLIYGKVLQIIRRQKALGYINPTECIIYGGDREWI